MSKAKIVLVDDHKDTRVMLKFVLDEWFAVDTYGNAREAFEASKKDRPDLVIVDMLLADSHGLELCRWMRADPILRNVPIIGLSGLPHDTEALSTEVDGFLTKPVDIDELLAMVQTCLGSPDKFFRKTG
jgi:two-component system phosphate regulon response regulator PhoB